MFGSKSGSRDNNSKSTWGAITETFKEKLETVTRPRGRRYSKEQSERQERVENTERHYADLARDFSATKTDQKVFDQNKETEMALEVFDTVLEDLHKDIHSANTSGGSASASGTSKSVKKKRRDRESFKNGGTWPRTRGGPVIEQGTGTILHPHKQYKERKPLSDLLNNMPQYPPADQEQGKESAPSVIYRDESRLRRSHKYNRDYRATTYDLGEEDAIISNHFIFCDKSLNIRECSVLYQPGLSKLCNQSPLFSKSCFYLQIPTVHQNIFQNLSLTQLDNFSKIF